MDQLKSLISDFYNLRDKVGERRALSEFRKQLICSVDFEKFDTKLHKQQMRLISKLLPLAAKSTVHDISGQQFNGLTAIKCVGKIAGGNGGCSVWLCRCECGRDKLLNIGDLRRAFTCGCKTVLDLRGKVFGYLVPLELVPNLYNKRRSSTWRCLCINCGNQKAIYDSVSLQCGEVQTCGLCGHRQFYKPIEINDIYGDLQVVEKIPGKHNRHAKWRCRCLTCGDEYTITATQHLRTRKHGCVKCGKIQRYDRYANWKNSHS